MTEEQAQQRFGCSTSEMESLIEEQAMGNPLMLAMAILSDAQHVMAGGNTETARQFINKSKYVISEVMDEERKRERAA